MRELTVQCAGAHGLHRMAYTEWGNAKNPRVLICVHGLTRCGRDFDFFAAAMADRYRVVCPDVVGRGQSDWLAVKDDYQIPQYVADMVTLIARLDVPSVHWLGTSMGGLIGMALAALPETPITRLVLNDVGPIINAAAIQRITQYVGQPPKFASMDEAERYIRAVSASFGRFTDAQWRHLTQYATRQTADGVVELVYDPGIAAPFSKAFNGTDIDLWPLYEAIHCPTLLVRGAESDLLSHDTALEMAHRGPRAALVEIPGVGHAPMFMSADQVGPVRDFLLAGN